MSSLIRVYVASPLGFTESGRQFSNETLLPTLRAAGVKPLDPWEDSEGKIAEAFRSAGSLVEDLAAVNAMLGRRNVAMIESSTAVFAVLDGPDVDSGTAAEIGYASGLPRKIVGWRSDFRSTGDNPGAVVNLQVEHFILRSGGGIHTTLEAAISDLVDAVVPADTDAG
jgi:nucleoside 2-deoxyribosyltransferase